MLHRAGSFETLTSLHLGNVISSIQGSADLFVSLNKSLEFVVQVSVLSIQDTAVVAESFNLTTAVVVSCDH
jgi:hypothetical protein